VKIHGSRGSCPVAITPARVEEITRSVWEFSHSRKLRTWNDVKKALANERRSLSQIYGGATTCVELTHPDFNMPIFLDLGTGFTTAGTDPDSGLNNGAFQANRGKVAIFLTHTHWDHIIGLPTVEQVFRSGNEFHFYGVHKNLRDRISTLFQEEHFPVPFHAVEKSFHFHQIELGSTIELGPFRVSHHAQVHPGGSFAYRFDDGKKVFVFATDTELRKIEAPHMNPGANMYSDADVLLLDAQFSPEDFETRQDYGHASIHMAVDFAVRERTKKLYLFHQSPTYSDDEIQAQLERAREYLRNAHKGHPLQIDMTVEQDTVQL